MDGLERMERALKAAGDAGDIQAATTIAREIRLMLKEVNPDVDAPINPAAEGARMAAKDTGTAEAVLIGAGRTGSKIGSGVKQLALEGAKKAGMDVQGNLDTLAAEQSGEDKTYAALRKERPFATAGGEALPYVAVPASAGILPAAAAVAGLEGLQYGSPEERMKRAIVGGGATAAGGLLAKGVTSFLAPVTKKAAAPAHQGALEAAERIGMRPTLGEATGSSFLRRAEDAAARVPGGAGVMAEHQARNSMAVNRAASRAIGEAADEMTPAVFDAAHRRLGKVFEDIKTLPGRPIKIGQNLASAADEVLRQTGKMLPQQQDAALVQLARQAKALAANHGRIDGEAYQLMRSGLSDAAFDATVGTNKQLYGKLLSALDDSADASLRSIGNDALADALKTVRPQYSNLKILEKGATVEAGNVSPAKVASTMRTNNPGAFRRGQFVGKDMGDIAAVGEGMKPLRAGSPTFERDVVSNPLSALMHGAWSYPVAKIATSPAATLYPRTLGKTSAARTVAEIANPSTRAAVAAALQQSGLLPIAPVAAE